MSESGFTWGDYVSWKARAEAAERRVAELEKTLRLAEEEIRLREESQIPKIPRGAQRRINELEKALGEASRTTAEDWKDALELAQLWAGYWADEPVVHMDTGKVGMLARSFLAAMIELGVIARRPLVVPGEPPE